MTLSIVFSKPVKNVAERLDRPYVKVRVWRRPGAALSAPAGRPSAGNRAVTDSSKTDTGGANSATSGTGAAAAGARSCAAAAAVYDAEFFTERQSFRRTFTEEELAAFKREHSGKTFRSVVERTEAEELTTLANKRGEARTFRRPVKTPEAPSFAAGADRKKKYIIEEGVSVPFLVRLGVMTREGKVVAQRYDKFRQINRFLEYIDDVLDELADGAAAEGGFSPQRPLRVVDFGCGKSYLTFAVHHLLSGLRHLDVAITGLDLKEDVIADCQKLAEESGCGGLTFKVGNIADYSDPHRPDMVITLHACDKATDYALDWAIRQGARVILSVPCCQHELNSQLQADGLPQIVPAIGSGQAKDGMPPTGGAPAQGGPEPDSPAQGGGGLASPFASLTRYGLIRERFAALATDAIRAELLEQAGYQVQVLEFIDMSHTPKNILLRAVKKREVDIESGDGQGAIRRSKEREAALLSALGVGQELDRLLGSRKEG